MEKLRLSKSSLLRKGREFEKVYRSGKRVHGKGFTLIYIPNDFGFSRVGISIHRQLKGAVRRNRIKRIVRESFRLQQKHYPACADIVFAVRPGFSLDSPFAISQVVATLTGSQGETPSECLK